MGNNINTSRGRKRIADTCDADEDGYITVEEAKNALKEDGFDEDELAFIAAVKALAPISGKVEKDKLLAYLDTLDSNFSKKVLIFLVLKYVSFRIGLNVENPSLCVQKEPKRRKKLK